jgi:curli production assembly/transport component CsgF
MYPKSKHNGRKGASLPYRVAALAALSAAGAFSGGAAHAQELTHRFLNPSFGGNPFNSEHLLGIANIHRPAEPKEVVDTPTADDLLVSQIRSSLTSTVSSTILSRIQNAKPGETGSFVLGDQQINFTRTATETTVTFTNLKTGETSQLVIPVTPTTPTPFPFSNSSAPLSAGQSAEQALGALSPPPLGVISPVSRGSESSLLPGFPPL